MCVHSCALSAKLAVDLGIVLNPLSNETGERGDESCAGSGVVKILALLKLMVVVGLQLLVTVALSVVLFGVVSIARGVPRGVSEKSLAVFFRLTCQ
jgi:hypothetical protein